jgi:hypothetical protein
MLTIFCREHGPSLHHEVFVLFHELKYKVFQPHYGPGVDSASNRNEYKESSWGVKDGRPARKADNLTAICEPIV